VVEEVQQGAQQAKRQQQGIEQGLVEAAAEGWATSLSCSDPSIAVSGREAGLPGTFAAGSSVDCTCANRRSTPPIAQPAVIPGLQGWSLLLTLLPGGIGAVGVRMRSL
jgi:hypothetical protein